MMQQLKTYVITAKEHSKHDQANNLRFIDVEQRETVLEAAFTAWPGDQGWKLNILAIIPGFILTALFTQC